MPLPARKLPKLRPLPADAPPAAPAPRCAPLTRAAQAPTAQLSADTRKGTAAYYRPPLSATAQSHRPIGLSTLKASMLKLQLLQFQRRGRLGCRQ